MRRFVRYFLNLFVLFLSVNGLQACELPAHPYAAALPVKITLKGQTTEQPAKSCPEVKLIQGNDNGLFYYLIPEGSKVKLRIVWDPVCHNEPLKNGVKDKYKKDQYDYVNGKGKISIEPDRDIGLVGGFYFFPLDAMSKYFQLQGNRKDIKEAFSRDIGIENKEGVIPDYLEVGPEYLFGQIFSKNFSANYMAPEGSSAAEYKNTPSISAESFDSPLIDGLNKAMPGVHKNRDEIEVDYILEGGKLVQQKDSKIRAVGIDDEKFLKYSNSGILMDDMKIAVTELKAEDYKPYIQDDKIHVEGLDGDENAENVKINNSTNEFEVTFTTPSISTSSGAENESDSCIKVYVKSPPAGYAITNVFWVWEEQSYERINSGKYELAEGSVKLPPDEDSGDNGEDPEEDGEDNEIDCSQYVVYKPKGNLRKCSVGFKITMSKAGATINYASYKIYDNSGPVFSELSIDNEIKYAETDGNSSLDGLKSKFNYQIKILDSNPYIDKDIVAESVNTKSLSQNKARMDVKFYYNYPVYSYSIEERNLKELNGLGLVDHAEGNKSGSSPMFKGYKHNTKWYWKLASDVTVDDIKTEFIRGDDARLIGSNSTIKGSFVIPNPKPWHVTQGDEANNFSVFAVLKDTAGNTHITEVFNNFGGEAGSAKPENLAQRAFAVMPKGEACEDIAANTKSPDAPVLVDELKSQVNWGGSSDKWQNILKIKSEDETAPEIQVIVLDTRTNHYHVFGTSENVAGGFNALNVRSDIDYASLGNIPYIGRNSAIKQSYNYSSFDGLPSLFEKYIDGDSAVSTVFDKTNKNGFVCAKNTRLIFYARAFDNIGYMDEDAGVFSFKATVYDGFNEKSTTKMNEPVECIFRKENVSDNAVSPYFLNVRAEDKKGNVREFKLGIAVTGKTLDIRTLEERRERIK